MTLLGNKTDYPHWSFEGRGEGGGELIQSHSWLTEYLDGGRGHGLAVGVPGVAGVHATVLRVHRQQVQRHVVEIVRRSEPVTFKQVRGKNEEMRKRNPENNGKACKQRQKETLTLFFTFSNSVNG